jgi:hypothetical protein
MSLRGGQRTQILSLMGEKASQKETKTDVFPQKIDLSKWQKELAITPA